MPGRPAAYVDKYFIQRDKVPNNSGRYFYQCRHCDLIIEHRENNLLGHLRDYDACPTIDDTERREILKILMAKVTNLQKSGKVTGADDASGEMGASKKRKGGTLDGYVDHGMSEAQKDEADVKLLRWLVHANIPFRAADDWYFEDYIHTLRPLYDPPSAWVLRKRIFDAESARVELVEEERLQAKNFVTLLFDGWEDKLKRSLYGTVAAGMNEFPSILSLDDQSGIRGTADNYLETVKRAIKKTGLDVKKIIALTTDNPTVMQAFRREFKAGFNWVITLACFLHGLNTILGKITAYPATKTLVTNSIRIVTFFRSSHYWGEQLAEKAKELKVTKKLRTHSETRWYSLILQALSIREHRLALQAVCGRDDARRKINGASPVAKDVLRIVNDSNYWELLDQVIRVCKPIVDGIGNLESREANLADCMLELIRIARHLMQVQNGPFDDLQFGLHAVTVFNREFHAMNTDIHALTLYLHPLCRRLAIHQSAKGRSFTHYATVAVGLASQWNWTPQASALLAQDLKLYNTCKDPFGGFSKDARSWWENLPIAGDGHPLKTLAITLFSIIPHSAEVERLFSDLGGIQGVKRSNLKVKTFEQLGKLRSHYSYKLWQMRDAEGKPRHRKHKHMHTQAEGGINTALVDRLNEEYTYVSPLSTEKGSQDAAGPSAGTNGEDAELGDYNMEEFEKDWADWEAEQEEITKARDTEGAAVIDAYSKEEFERVEKGLGPEKYGEEVSIHSHSGIRQEGFDVLEILRDAGITD